MIKILLKESVRAMAELINTIIKYLSGLSGNLDLLFDQSGYLPYLLLWVNIFLETGGVVFGFLPGNSVLLATAAFAAVSDKVRIEALFLLFFTASLLGDLSSFMIGRFLGKKYKLQDRIRFINQEKFEAAHDYFEEHGRQTFIVARFVPIFRGIMPLAAGFTQASYRKILPYSLIGVILWNVVYLSLGYFFGNIPMVRDNFSLIIFVIVVVTMIPTFYVVWRNYRKFKTMLSDKPAPDKPPADSTTDDDPTAPDPTTAPDK